MIFFKRTLPLIICFLMGVLLIIQYFVPHHYSEAFLTEVNDWEIIIFGFAMFLGIYSLFHFHLNKVKRQVLLLGVCKACAGKMGSLQAAQAQGLHLLDEMSGHPSIASFMDQGYKVITF